MRCVLPALVVLLSSAVGAAVPLPAGASRIVAAPSGVEASKAFAPLLKNTATRSVSLSAQRINFELQLETGFKLLEAGDLAANGVDASKGWVVFDHDGASYLGVFVSRKKPFDAAMATWAARRGLPVKEARTRKGVTKVSWSRTAGSRAAAGYARKGSVAVVLLDAAGRTDGLERALTAWDGAAPVKPPVDAPLLAWASRWEGARDVWVGFSPRPDGMDVTGRARKADGWFRREVERSRWISAATADAVREPPLRLRTTPGRRMIDAVAALLSEALGSGSVRAAPLDQAKALELLSLAVDADALKKSTRRGAPEWGAVLSPMARLFLPAPATARSFHHFRVETDPAGAVVVPHSIGTREEPPTGRSEGLSCARGTAVAGARLDVAQVSHSLLSVGLLSAMRNDVLLGVFGVNAEYGHLLRASRPVIGLVCEEPKGAASFEARWRFTPRAG